MSTRADKFTQLAGQSEVFSDFLNSFSVHPITGTLAKTTNVNAVRQSIKNLVLTNYGERMFQPQVGSDILRHLFEPMNTLTAKDISDSIALTINHNEPRAKLLGVDVRESSDYNTVVVNIVFSLINNNTPVSMDVTLKRVR
jgi:phage baseplate assembly protein W